MEALARDFVPFMRNLLRSLPKPKQTVFLVLAGIDGLSRSVPFASWFKRSMDEFATSAPEAGLFFLFVDREERRIELLARQPSLVRIFNVIEIMPWSKDEAFEFYRQYFRRGGATISPNDIGTLILFTDGLPVLAHELGDAVWRTARTPNIGKSEVMRGIVSTAEAIGSKLLEPGMLKALRSERYYSILREITYPPQTHFRRSEVLARLGGKDKRSLDSFLRRMKELGAIEADPKIRGGYRFPNRLHALYYHMASLRCYGLRNIP